MLSSNRGGDFANVKLLRSASGLQFSFRTAMRPALKLYAMSDAALADMDLAREDIPAHLAKAFS